MIWLTDTHQETHGTTVTMLEAIVITTEFVRITEMVVLNNVISSVGVPVATSAVVRSPNIEG